MSSTAPRRKAIALALLVSGWLASCQSPRPTSASPSFFPAPEAPRYEVLVSAAWVKALLDASVPGSTTPRPPTCRHSHFVILEVGWAKTKDAKRYLAGHIPGAIHFNTDDLETDYPQWRLRDVAALHEAIGRAGITPKSTVVVYGDRLMATARVWWALKYAGVSDVRLLDGTIDHWRAAGYAVETGMVQPRPTRFSAAPVDDIVATTAYVRRRLHDPRIYLGDVRSISEYDGRKSGYSYLDAKGRLPGAIHLGDADDDAGRYQQRDGRLVPPAQIRSQWLKQGLTPEKELILYCGGGWRSSVAFFYAWLMGWENVRNYSDGWCGWSTAYVRDPAAQGTTLGWRQQPTGNQSINASRSD
jgi:3-mercaptopyruvate sulfurtransferase SseA